jgi:hypothetical protein
MGTKTITSPGALSGDDGLPTPLLMKCRSDLWSAKNELSEVFRRIEAVRQEEAKLEIRRVQLQSTIAVLEPIISEAEQFAEQKIKSDWAGAAKAGIQECCFRLLIEEACPLSAGEVRSLLEERGVDMTQYHNPLAVIHTSLKRIPDRVRSFKQKRRGSTMSGVTVVRVYEAIGQDSPESGGPSE